MDMGEWPLLPDIRFGRYHDYFQALEKKQGRVSRCGTGIELYFHRLLYDPVPDQNANRTAEDSFYDSEALGAMEYLCGRIQEP